MRDDIPLQTGRRAIDLNDWTGKVNSDIKTLARNIEAMSGGMKKIDATHRIEAARKQHEAQVAAIVQLAEKQNSHAHSYANVVVGIGYAGFYALWSLAEKGAYPSVRAFAGLAMALSLVIFVAWEVFTMIYATLQYQNVNKALAKSDEGATLAAWQRASRQISSRIDCLWIWQLIPAVLFAVAGAGALLFIFAAELYRTMLA
ncbi:MAG: hypothetical protein AB7O64_10650 [Methylibium sp.]